MSGLFKIMGGAVGGLIPKGIKALVGKKKKEEDGIQISDRKATDEEIKIAAEKRLKKLQADISTKKNTPTLIGNSFGSGG